MPPVVRQQYHAHEGTQLETMKTTMIFAYIVLLQLADGMSVKSNEDSQEIDVAQEMKELARTNIQLQTQM